MKEEELPGDERISGALGEAGSGRIWDYNHDYK